MRTTCIPVVMVAFIVCTVPGLFAQPQAEREAPAAGFVSGQRETGSIILDEVSVKDGILSFRAATGGCTDKSSFTVDIKKEKSVSGTLPHYELTVKRVKPDDCKGMFPEGVVVQFDLGKDVGLKGRYTLAVVNPLAFPAAQ